MSANSGRPPGAIRAGSREDGPLVRAKIGPGVLSRSYSRSRRDRCAITEPNSTRKNRARTAPMTAKVASSFRRLRRPATRPRRDSTGYITATTSDGIACGSEGDRYRAGLSQNAGFFAQPRVIPYALRRRGLPDTTKPPVGGFVPTSVDPYGQQCASAGTTPVAVAAKVVGVAMVDFTESPPFEIDGTSASHSGGGR